MATGISNRYKKLLSNTGLIALGSFGSKLIVFFMVRFYTACLTPAEYSTADLIMETAKLLMPLLCVGITDAVFRFALDGDSDKKEVFTVGLLTVFLGCSLLLPVLPLLSLSQEFSPYLGLIAAYVLCANLHSLVSYYIRTRDHFRFYALQGIFNTAMVVGLNLLFLLGFSLGVEGYVLSVVLADFVTFLLVFVKERLWTELKSPFRISGKTVKAMLKYSIPLIPTTIFWWITSVSDRYMIKWMVSAEAGGLYAAANKIPTMISLLCSIFIQAWGFSSVVEKDEKERSRFFTDTFEVYSGLLYVAAGGIVLFCQVFASLLFDRAYFTAWQCVPILTLATVFSSFVSFTGSMYTVRKKSIAAFFTAMFGAAVNVILNGLLIPDRLFGLRMADLGAMGAAIATVASYLLVFIIRALSARRYVRFDLKPLRLLWNSLLLCAMSLLLVFCMPSDYSGTGFGAFFAYLKEGWLCYLLLALLFLLLVLLNAPPLLRGVRILLRRPQKGKNEK